MIYNNCLSYLTTDTKGKQFLALMQDFYIPVELEEGGVLSADRRLLNIPLMASAIQKYSIGTVGRYLYNEKLIKVKTEGKIIVVVNTDPSIPTRLVYFGNYNPLSDNMSTSEGDIPLPEEENSPPSPLRIEGFLVDDLDEENKENSRIHFLGPIGSFMAYIKCGVT